MINSVLLVTRCGCSQYVEYIPENSDVWFATLLTKIPMQPKSDDSSPIKDHVREFRYSGKRDSLGIRIFEEV